jgi:hypothetical protein
MKWRRTKFTLATIVILIGGAAARQYLFHWPIATAGPSVPVLPTVPPKTSPDFEIEGVVAKVWIPQANDEVDAMDSVDVAKCWLVKLTSITIVKGNFPESSINILVHSPSQDLGVRRIGQTVTLELDRSIGPVTVLVPPGRTTDGFPDISKVKYRLAGFPGMISH